MKLCLSKAQGQHYLFKTIISAEIYIKPDVFDLTLSPEIHPSPPHTHTGGSIYQV
jgi:hypothetical protein